MQVTAKTKEEVLGPGHPLSGHQVPPSLRWDTGFRAEFTVQRKEGTHHSGRAVSVLPVHEETLLPYLS